MIPWAANDHVKPFAACHGAMKNYMINHGQGIQLAIVNVYKPGMCQADKETVEM